MQTREDRWISKVLGGNRYVITEKLGEGGMGTVYLAEDRKLGSYVVVKMPHATMLHDREFAARFQVEIQSLVSLTHAHIVRVLDVGQYGEFPFVVLQFLSGGSLESRLYPEGQNSPQPQTLKQVGSWLTEISSALDFIHGKGFVHRDIKPANILFDEDQHAYLTDFGIAKVLACEENNQAKKLTATGMILGTAEYMAPELLQGKQIDHRVDQYALAVMVFEALSGTRPYEESNPVSLAFAQTQKPIPQIHTRIAGLPDELSNTLSRAMSLSPNDRFTSCAEFTTAIRSLTQNLVSQTMRRKASSQTTSIKSAQRGSVTIATSDVGTPSRAKSAPPPPTAETQITKSVLQNAQSSSVDLLNVLLGRLATRLTALINIIARGFLKAAKALFVKFEFASRWKATQTRRRTIIVGTIAILCVLLFQSYSFVRNLWKLDGTLSELEVKSNDPSTLRSSVIYSNSEKQEFWEGVAEGQTFSLNDRQLFSRKEWPATPGAPLTVQLRFVMDGTPNGIMVVTRTNGEVAGLHGGEYRQGLAFIVDSNSARIQSSYSSLSRQLAKDDLLPELIVGQEYSLSVQDTGTGVRLIVLSSDGTTLAHLTANAPRQGTAEKIIVRKLDMTPSRPMKITSLIVSGATGNARATGADRNGLQVGTGDTIWEYTTSQPGPRWTENGFDTKSWKTGRGGFGFNNGGGVFTLKTRTRWTERDIWLRTKVTLPAEIRGARVTWHYYHDDNIEIFVNRRRIVERTGWSTNYVSESEYPTALVEGENIVAVHCHNDGLPCGVDVGFDWLHVSK